jgi:hypothetical protein
MLCPECDTLVTTLKTAFDVCARIVWILALCIGKKSNTVFVTKAIKPLMTPMGGSQSAGSVSMAAGLARSEGGSTILTGRTGVWSVISICFSMGHERDHAGWVPL